MTFVFDYSYYEQRLLWIEYEMPIKPTKNEIMLNHPIYNFYFILDRSRNANEAKKNESFFNHLFFYGYKLECQLRIKERMNFVQC